MAPSPSIFNPLAMPPRRKSPFGIVKGPSKSDLSGVIARDAPVSKITGWRTVERVLNTVKALGSITDLVCLLKSGISTGSFVGTSIVEGR